jgi:hypothetical protein
MRVNGDVGLDLLAISVMRDARYRMLDTNDLVLYGAAKERQFDLYLSTHAPNARKLAAAIAQFTAQVGTAWAVAVADLKLFPGGEFGIGLHHRWRSISDPAKLQLTVTVVRFVLLGLSSDGVVAWETYPEPSDSSELPREAQEPELRDRATVEPVNGDWRLPMPQVGWTVRRGSSEPHRVAYRRLVEDASTRLTCDCPAFVYNARNRRQPGLEGQPRTCVHTDAVLAEGYPLTISPGEVEASGAAEHGWAMAVNLAANQHRGRSMPGTIA